MKISIITAVLNGKDYIESCIKSVLAQSYDNIEFIIIDGGSTDGTLEIIKKLIFNNQHHSFVSEKDNGIYDALNKGLNLATGDVVGFLNSDDIFYDEHVISKIAKTFSSEKTDSVYSDLLYVYKKNPGKILRYWKAGEFKYDSLIMGWMPPHPTFFIKKSIYDEYGGFDTSYKIASDYEIILRFLIKHKISTAYLPEVTVKMRTGGASNKNFSSLILKSREDYRALKDNSIPLPIRALILKNFSKLNQFLIKGRMQQNF